jgi:protein AIR1/2
MMRNASSDENDSRTSSVGGARPRANGSKPRSRNSSRDGKVGKKQRRSKESIAEKDLQDLIPFVDESEGSETGEMSEGDDSIMLNLRSRSSGAGTSSVHEADGFVPFLVDPKPTVTGFTPMNRSSGETAQNLSQRPDVRKQQTSKMSKEESSKSFAQVYSVPPVVLADLTLTDLEVQARHFYYDRTVHDLDLSKPIKCTECLQEGHLAIVCPTKEVRISRGK